MGASVHYRGGAAGDGDLFPLAGQTEIERLWQPIIQSENLPLLAQAFSAGLTIDRQYHAEFGREITVVLRTLESIDDSQRNVDAIRRCRLLHDLLERYPPDAEVEIYVG